MPKVGMEFINKEIERYGRNLFGQPNWKISWSEDLTEIRTGVFNDFVGDIFLRTTRGPRRVRKYNYIFERWILERFIPGELAHNPEIPESGNGTYEPVYVFEDGNGNYLQPTLKVVEFLIQYAERGHKMTEQELVNDLKAKEEREIEQILQALGE